MMTNMKKQLIYTTSFLVIGIFLAVALSVAGASTWIKTGNTIDNAISATTTPQVSTGKPVKAYKVLDAGRDYLGQGGCLKIADSDGDGFTYLTANNGILSASVTSCE